MTVAIAETYRLTGDLPGHVREFGSVIVGAVLNPPAGFELVSNPLDTEHFSVASEDVTPGYPDIPSTQLKFWRNGPVVASARLPGQKSEDGSPTADEIHLFQNGTLTCFTYLYPSPLQVRQAAARLNVDRSDKAESSGLTSNVVATISQKPKDYLKGTKPVLIESVVGVSETKLNRITSRLPSLQDPDFRNVF